jgi:hypothetical protein
MRSPMDATTFVRVVAVLVVTLLGSATRNSYAEEENTGGQETNNCNITCAPGEKVVSFIDGTKVSCVCSAESAMVPTVEDPSMVNSGAYVDEGQRE